MFDHIKLELREQISLSNKEERRGKQAPRARRHSSSFCEDLGLGLEFLYGRSDAMYKTFEHPFPITGHRLLLVCYLKESCNWVIYNSKANILSSLFFLLLIATAISSSHGLGFMVFHVSPTMFT